MKKEETFDLYAEIEKLQNTKAIMEFAKWCEKTHVAFDDYGIRTAEETVKEFFDSKNNI